MAIIEIFFFGLLDNKDMLSVLIRIASMSLNICFLKLSAEFRRDSKTSSN